MSDYSQDKNHKINAYYGICWESPRIVRGNKIGGCWRVYNIATGRDEYATYDSADLAVRAAEDLAATKDAPAIDAAPEATSQPAPKRAAAGRKSPSQIATEIGASYGINGQIWDNA